MYLIQASPLSKVYMREFTRMCVEHPEFIGSPWDHPKAGEKTADGQVIPKRPFVVTIQRTMGSISLQHNKPIHIAKLIPHNPNRKNDDQNPDELPNLVNWLAGTTDGRPCEETAIYGIVRLAIDLDVSGAIMDVAQIADGGNEDAAVKNYRELQQTLLKQTRDALKEARTIADEKVKAQMRITHTNMLQSWERLRTEGKAAYMPSSAELVGSYVLNEEIQKSEEASRIMLENINRLMDQTRAIK